MKLCKSHCRIVRRGHSRYLFRDVRETAKDHASVPSVRVSRWSGNKIFAAGAYFPVCTKYFPISLNVKSAVVLPKYENSDVRKFKKMVWGKKVPPGFEPRSKESEH